MMGLIVVFTIGWFHCIWDVQLEELIVIGIGIERLIEIELSIKIRKGDERTWPIAVVEFLDLIKIERLIKRERLFKREPNLLSPKASTVLEHLHG